MDDNRELRTYTAVELRVEAQEEGEKPKIRGHAAVFDQLSEDLGGFVEKIRPGAFAKTTREADIRALWNHDANYPLGRTKAGTLRVWEDEIGLAIELDPPETSYARDLQESIRRGDVDQMSFGFRTIRDEWDTAAEPPIRTLVEVQLYDVSPVTFPAYPQTSVAVRTLEKIKNETAAPILEDHPADYRQAAGRLDVMKRKLQLAEKLLEG
jgi:hypothetical protein